ncbi:hypothetical protein [Nonomuraea sp. KM90]|uniref:hypothetical protein n=1 Tax=Nonomuraea sp. KM90 TaxID=3457428 RepID=UPI003FCD59AC
MEFAELLIDCDEVEEAAAMLELISETKGAGSGKGRCPLHREITGGLDATALQKRLL